jgi:hypothetical protein
MRRPMRCDHSGPSGTRIDCNTKMIFEVVGTGFLSGIATNIQRGAKTPMRFCTSPGTR